MNVASLSVCNTKMFGIDNSQIKGRKLPVISNTK